MSELRTLLLLPWLAAAGAPRPRGRSLRLPLRKKEQPLRVVQIDGLVCAALEAMADLAQSGPTRNWPPWPPTISSGLCSLRISWLLLCNPFLLFHTATPDTGVCPRLCTAKGS